MADEADRAGDQQQIIFDATVKKIINTPLDTSNISGICWNCGEITGKSKRWCNSECRDDWEQG
jgi:hypothetical protein